MAVFTRLFAAAPFEAPSDPDTITLGENAATKRQDAFIELISTKTRVYLGEVFEVNLNLFALSPHDLNMPQIQAEGFTLSKMAQPTRSQTRIGETIYQVFSFATAATPVKTGLLSLGPAACTLVLRFRNQVDPSEPIAGLFGDGTELRQITIHSEPATVEVLQLPEESQPADFTGAIGTFSLSVTANPTSAAVGDPITLKVEIGGQGSLNTLVMSKNQHRWREFRTYPPTSRIETSDTLGLRGIKTFEQVVVPQNSEIKELPSLSFSYFDPDKNVYQTLSHLPIRLSIEPTSKAATQPIVLAKTPSTADPITHSDIIHIKAHIGMLSAVPKPLVTQTWFLSVQGIPLILLASVFIWKKRRAHPEENPKRERKLRVQRLIEENMRELKRLSEAEQTEAFFAVTFRLLQEILGEKLDLSASAITEAVLGEPLRRHGAHEQLVSELHSIFHLCNQARYAPTGASWELNRLTPRIEAVIKSLEDLNWEPSM